MAPEFFQPDMTGSKKHGLGPAKTRPPAPPGAYVGILAWFAPPLASLGLPWSSPWLPLASPWPPFGCPLAPLGVPLASLWPPLAPPWRTFGVILASRINGQVRKNKGSEKIWALAPIGALRRSKKASAEPTVLLNAIEICIDGGQKENDAFED